MMSSRKIPDIVLEGIIRALVTARGLEANRSQDAIYPTSLKDAEGCAIRDWHLGNIRKTAPDVRY